jgi:hypothetical protein
MNLELCFTPKQLYDANVHVKVYVNMDYMTSKNEAMQCCYRQILAMVQYIGRLLSAQND